MKMILLIILAVVILAVVGIVVTAYSRPTEMKVERSMTTTASAEELYAIVSDMSRWQEWSPWQKLDPNMKLETGGAPGEVGAFYSWDGNGNVGAGKTSIVSVKPNSEVELKLDMYRPFATVNRVFWRIEEAGGQRKFTWAMEGKNDALMPRIVGLFMDMDKMVGGAFDEGLASLKKIAETPK